MSVSLRSPQELPVSLLTSLKVSLASPLSSFLSVAWHSCHTRLFAVVAEERVELWDFEALSRAGSTTGSLVSPSPFSTVIRSLQVRLCLIRCHSPFSIFSFYLCSLSPASASLPLDAFVLLLPLIIPHLFGSSKKSRMQVAVLFLLILCLFASPNLCVKMIPSPSFCGCSFVFLFCLVSFFPPFLLSCFIVPPSRQFRQFPRECLSSSQSIVCR